MPKKIKQYIVDGKTYNHRWIAETIAELKRDGYLYSPNIKISNFPSGFHIRRQETTIVVTESDTIEVIGDKYSATSEEILTLIQKGWSFTYDEGSFYEIPVKDNLVDTIKEVMDYFIEDLIRQPEPQSAEITEKISYNAHDQIFSSKNIAQIFEDVVANKTLAVTDVSSLFEDIYIFVPTKRTKLTVGSHQIRIETELHQKVTSEDILRYDELGYNWSTDGRYSIWRTKTTSINRQLFAKVLRDIDELTTNW